MRTMLAQHKGRKMATEITLPWMPKELSPNARKHWAQLAKAKAFYRHACSVTAMSQGLKKIDAQGLHIDITFYPPSRRKYDLDNLLASMKSGLDGIADVVGVDDSNWSITLRKSKEIGGMVKIKIVS